MRRRIGVCSVVLAALAASSAGCTDVGESSDPPPASSTASPTLLEQIVPDYNVRNNAAIAAAGRYDSSLWKTADTGAVLDRDVFETRYKEVFNEPAQPGELLYHGAQQYGAPSEGYPKWVVGTVTSTRNPDTASTAAPTSAPTAPTAAPSAATPSATPSNEPDVAVAVFEQAGDAAPWLMSHSVATRPADLPTETKGEAATLRQQQNATVMGQLLATWLTSGEAPPWLDLRKAAEFRAKHVEPGQFAERNLTCSLYSDPTPQFGVSDAVRVVRAGSSSFIALSFKCKTTFVAAQGGIVDWDSGFEKLYPNEHPSPRLQRPWVATLLVVQPDETSPAIIGVRGGYVL